MLNGTEGDEYYTVSIDLLGTDVIEMLQFCISYDSELIELKNVTAGTVFKGISYPTVSGDIPGKLFFSWDALKPLKPGQLLILQFIPKENVSGIAQIWIDGNEDFIAADGNYQAVDLIRNNVQFVIETPDSDDDSLQDGEEQEPTEKNEGVEAPSDIPVPTESDSQQEQATAVVIPATESEIDEQPSVLWNNDQLEEKIDEKTEEQQDAMKTATVDPNNNPQTEDMLGSVSNTINDEGNMTQPNGQLLAIAVITGCVIVISFIVIVILMKRKATGTISKESEE